MTVSSDPGEPKQYKNAMMDGPDKDKWSEAIKQEINNFLKRQVWKKFPRDQLQGRKPLKSRWVFKKKTEADDTIRYKARVVVKGYNQIPGVDFTESFSPVATDTTTRLIFAFVLIKKMGLRDCRCGGGISKCRFR
jgi:Reverse transcriptase (RNA-dependent DNA polymerase)